MGIWDKVRETVGNELIEIIEWNNPPKDTIVHKFPVHNDQIKNNAQLIVRPSQVAVFINEGTIADVFGPGTYSLNTKNLPILATLKGWKYGFESPFKADVFFVKSSEFVNNKWGTQNPIMLRDPEFGPVRIRTYGLYSKKVIDAGAFIKKISGTEKDYTKDDLVEYLRDIVISRFTDVIGESKIPILDMAANYDELGKFIATRITDDFAAYGLQITKIMVENISLPPNVEEALDKRSSMGIIGNLNAYSQFQSANAMEDAANNPGGEASAGIGMGMGFAMANQMGQQMLNQPHGQDNAPAAGGPPPVPGATQYFTAVNGQQTGPFPLQTLKLHIEAGSPTKDTLVWCEGMDGWTAASSVDEVNALFNAGPPPLPPQA